MSEIDSINLAKAYAAEWEVPWKSVRKTEKERTWWFFSIEWYTFTIDTGNGSAVVSIHAPSSSVNRFEYYPDGENGWLLPLWAAYPGYACTTIGWKWSYGEQYNIRWHSWYQSLPDESKAQYRQKYPPPEDAERGWKGFYEWNAHG
jgi:hypothetical protein